MENELPDDQMVGSDNAAAATGRVSSVCKDPKLETMQIYGEQIHQEPDNSDDPDPAKDPLTGTLTAQGGNQVQQRLDESPAAAVNAISGNDAKLYSRVTYNYLSPADKLKDLATYVSKSSLPPARR